MSDFVVAWRDVWLPLLGNDGSFSLYYNGSSVWSINYVDLTSYVLYVLVILWVVTLSVRLLRKLICGVVR